MVVIYTNENNPAALKVLVSLKYSNTPAEIKIVTSADANISSTKLLPYVVVNEDTVLISSNAAVQYFLPSTAEDKELVQQWLEFQSFELGPCIAAALGSSSKVQNLKNSLLNKLKILNEILKETPINGKSIAACDIAIWSTLYPLYTDEALSKEYFELFPNMCTWMKKISEEKNVQDALVQYKVAAGVVSYQALSTGARYPGYTPSAAAESPTLDNVSFEEVAAAKASWNKGLNKVPQPKKDVYPVLPVPGEKNVLITSALPYVNNVPHLGNIIGCVLSADVFARFSRLCNWNTLYIGGTDEYGTATETKALEEGLTPQQICDKYFEIHNSIYRWFNIGFDYFGRTTTPEQTNIVQDLFHTLNKNGFMLTQAVEQLLCQNCNRYLADRFVEGGCPHPGCNYEDARGDQCDGCGKLVNAIDLKNPRCKVCKSAPVQRTSSQFFLDLPKLEPLLLHWMEKSTPGWTNNAKVISKSWMKEGLKPRCITRDLKWGIPVPLDGYRDKVFYVWFDAPIGYISITAKYSKEWKKWWQPAKETEISFYQFMAKDNVPFHSVMFPACMLGAQQDWIKVTNIMATEYLNYEDGKFSKSRGVGVFGTDAQNTGIPSDVWRFYLLYVRPEGQDSSFSWDDLATKNNSELLNNLGNFANRALMFTEKFFNSQIPEMYPNDEDYTVLAHCTKELKGYVASLEKAKLRDGIRYILAISKHGNQYMQSTQPWVLLKGSEEDKKRAGTVIGICCNITCLLATLMFPYMPDASRSLMAQLNSKTTTILTPENPEIVILLAPGHKIGKAAPLFNKIELAFIQEMKLKFGGVQQASEKAGGDVVSDVKSLEKAVQEQAAKVRSLKESGAAKPVWQPEVAILLDLKKKLEVAQKAAPKSETPKPESNSQTNGIPSDEDIKILESEIEAQGLLVRKLKEGGAPKAEWSPQVDKLLELKGKLAVATGKPLAAPGKGKKESSR